MYEVDAFWLCDSCGYSNANLDRCIMCNARGPSAQKTPARTATATAEAGTVEGEADDDDSTLKVAEFRKASYATTQAPNKRARRANRKRATRTIWQVIGALVVSELLTGMAAFSWGIEGADLIKFNLLTSVVFFGMIGLFALARSAEMQIRPRLVRGSKAWAVAEGVLVGGSEALAVTFLFRWITGGVSADSASFGLAAEGTAFMLLFGVLVFVIMAPLAEELVFRGFMAEVFRSRGKWVAVCASALAFALAHRMLIMLPYFFVGGVILALVYFHRGLIASISAHAAFNGMLLVVALVLVAGPPQHIESGGSTFVLPGHWQVDHNDDGNVVATGPLSAMFELTYVDMPGPVSTTHLALPLGNSGLIMPGDVVIDQDTVTITQIPAGEAVSFDADVYGMDGKVVMLPRDTRVWILSITTTGSERAVEDWQGILWSWRVP
jgi:membrane protease YdiL (CAAX protease family)